MKSVGYCILICGLLVSPSLCQGPGDCIVDQLMKFPNIASNRAIGASFPMSIKLHKVVFCDSKIVQIDGVQAAIHRASTNITTYTAPWDATRLLLQYTESGSTATLNITLLNAQASDTGSVFTVAAGGQTSVGIGLTNVTNCGNSTLSGVNQNVPDGKIFMSSHTFSCMSGFVGNDQFAICQADAMWNLTSFCVVTTNPPASSDPTTNSSTQTSNQTTANATVAVSTPSSTTDVTAETTMPVTDSGQPQSRSLDSGEAALVAVGTCAGITIIVFVGLFCVVSKKYPEETVKWKICAVCTCVLCVGDDGICGRCCCCCVNCSICTCCCCCFAVAAKRRGRKNSSKVSPRNSQSDMPDNAKHV